MTHAQLVEEISWWMHGAPKGRVRRTLALFVDAILDEVREGRSVTVPGLGTFSRATRKARRIRNPQTKELMQLSETTTVKFTAAKAAKERVKP